MELSVNNIGRIDTANIKIDGITVVAGFNGSGKSTISKSLYTILKTFFDLDDNISRQKRNDIRWIISQSRKEFPDISLSLKSRVKVADFMMKESVSDQDFKLFIENQLADNKVRETVYKYAAYLYDKYSEHEEIDNEYFIQHIAQIISEQMFSRQINTIKNTKAKKTGRICNDDSFIEYKEQVVTAADGPENFWSPVYISTSDLIDSVGNDIKFFSENNTENISYANSQLTDLLMNERSASDYSASEFSQLQAQVKITEDLFNQIVQGNMYIKEDSLAYYDDWSGGDIALGNIASGIRIFLILKRLVHNGTFLTPTCLIIDEPETNLHPEWQLRLAELLVLFYKSFDIKIYINTHSPYFSRAIEYYAYNKNALQDCNFYCMKSADENGMYTVKDVTENLGIIYDMLAEPFNRIM